MTNNQIWQLSNLINEFYPNASNFYVDEAEERVYFEVDGSEMQAFIDREDEEVIFEFKRYEDWFFADSVPFERVNEINEAPVF